MSAKSTSKVQEVTYKPTEVARIMQLSALRIRRMCQEGKFPNATKVDGQWVIPAADVKGELERRVAATANYSELLNALDSEPAAATE